MRKSREEAAQTRVRIVETASQQFRSKGLDGTGVSDLMSAAGLTHGGFYRHFESKDALISEACTRAIQDIGAVVGQSAALEAGQPINVKKAIQSYLSPAHLHNVAQGCPFAALGSDLARGSEPVRNSATEGFKAVVTAMAEEGVRRGEKDAWTNALGVATSLIGALSMARMVNDPDLAERILAEARTRLTKLERESRRKLA
jgi:TetR/AcrR family transcriptional regulator, transcriptional repressor for nem operon